MNAKFSGQYFYMNKNIQVDFQICIIVPLRLHPASYLFVSLKSENQQNFEEAQCSCFLKLFDINVLILLLFFKTIFTCSRGKFLQTLIVFSNFCIHKSQAVRELHIRCNFWCLSNSSIREVLSYRNQSINFLLKSMDWFLYDRNSVRKQLKDDLDSVQII